MRAFNMVMVAWKDQMSGFTIDLRIQFKFCDTWQNYYRVGDQIEWGGNNIGPKNAEYVLVDGCVDGQASIGVGEDFEVHIHANVIEKVADMAPAAEG